MRGELLGSVKRVVVKVGSGVIFGQDGLDLEVIRALSKDICTLWDQGAEVVLVSSGAVATGKGALGIVGRPPTIVLKQAAAAIGQSRLMRAYKEAFQPYNRVVAQILLTGDDLANRRRFLNARNTLMTLLEYRVTPIINENDTVVVQEIRFGDNDTLGALVANLIEADALVIMTDQPGLYTADPRKDPQAALVSEARAGDPELEKMAGGAGSAIGRGGMLTKLLAAKRAARSGAHTVIAWGLEPDVLVRLCQGEAIGTQLVAGEIKTAARKQWLADHLQLGGRLQLDAGAAKALREAGKSLLPIGVKQGWGEFERGEVVACLDPEGREIARGLVNYSADETRRITGRASQEIEAVLGYVDEPELIHRDNLVLL